MKYMLLSKIMQNRASETSTIINSKSEIDAMAAIATALQDRALKQFEQVRAKYKQQIDEDPIIHFHLEDLNETLLEQNILRILEPFSRVEIAHVAELMELPLQRTQTKLSE